jgi:hypothetical protein
VLNAVRFMYAGAAASLIGIVIDLMTLSSTKSSIERHSPNLTASQVNSLEHTLLVGFIVGGVVGAGLWIFMAQSCKSGRNWARITATVLFAIETIDQVVGIAMPVATSVKIFAPLVWLIGLGAVVFLWRGTATAFFSRPQS